MYSTIKPLKDSRNKSCSVADCSDDLLFFLLLGGCALYIVSMTSVVAKSLGEESDPRDIVDNFPTGRWMLFLLLIGLMSIFISVPFNQVMLLSY